MDLVDLLNNEVGKYIRWCTPSVLQEAKKVTDIYGSDVSASFSFTEIR
jgi:lysine decarboxylase